MTFNTCWIVSCICCAGEVPLASRGIKQTENRIMPAIRLLKLAIAPSCDYVKQRKLKAMAENGAPRRRNTRNYRGFRSSELKSAGQ
jgi:hypothetical protein